MVDFGFPQSGPPGPTLDEVLAYLRDVLERGFSVVEETWLPDLGFSILLGTDGDRVTLRADDGNSRQWRIQPKGPTGQVALPHPPSIADLRSRVDARLAGGSRVALGGSASLSATPHIAKPLSVFISYGSPDEQFAEKLNGALKKCGAATFFFKADAPAGRRLHEVMREGVNNHEIVVVICSELSLARTGVRNEIDLALAREAREGASTRLVPVRLDDHVFTNWDKVFADEIKGRVIADFRNHEDPQQFDRAVYRLMKDLASLQPDD